MSPIPWFKVDDKLHDHRKARAAGKSAMGVWVLAGSWCGNHLTDGFVPRAIVSRWGSARDAAALVNAGLWEPAERNGEPGWLFHNWEDFQPTKAEVEAEQQKKREAGRLGGKASGRSRREARAEASAEAPASEVVEPRPVPSRPVLVVTSPSQSSSAPASLDDDGLTRIRQALNNCPKAHAAKTADFVLAKAPSDVRNPVAYVLRAIETDPDLYRYRRGNPRRGEECPTHAGEWADACRACAADQKAGNA